MPIHGGSKNLSGSRLTGQSARRAAGTRVPEHQEPSAMADASHAGAPNVEELTHDPATGSAALGADHYLRPQMPVSHNDAGLNTDLSGVIVNRAAGPKHTLSVSEILEAPPQRRGELLRRFSSFLSLQAGGKIGAAAVHALKPGCIERGGAKAVIDDDKIVLTFADREVTIDRSQNYSHREADALSETALLVSEALLFNLQGGEAVVDKKAAQLHLHLLGGDGMLSRGSRRPLAAHEGFENPKLLCWDFNGTVEKFGDGRTRGDLARTSRAMERRGATSLITTTIFPEKPEDFMARARVAFGGYYGKGEVRPTRGNKQYLGLAAAHGISADEAPARMAIFGDSTTDIPADLPGTVFFHNDAMTPAPAIELMLHALDVRGHGSLRRGLDDVLDDVLQQGTVQSARLGDATFNVELRNSGDDQHPVWIPTIFGVRFDLDQAAMTAGLKDVPSSADLDGRARFQLLIEYLADGLADAEVAPVLAGVQGSKGARPALAAVKRRLQDHEVAIEAGRESTQKFETLLEKPVAIDVIAKRVEKLAALGDAEVAAALPGLVALMTSAAPQHAADIIAALEDHAAALRAAVQDWLPTAVPYYASAPGGPLRAKLERLAKNPLPLAPKAQEATLKTIARAKETAVPGGKEIAELLLAGLDDLLTETRLAVLELFAERAAAAPALLAQAENAAPLAQRREANFASIRTAVANCGA